MSDDLDNQRASRQRASRFDVRATWHGLNHEQQAAAVGSLLLIASTLGPFSFVEAAIALVGAAVLLLLTKRGQRRSFQLPFADGTLVAAAGCWCALLIVVRLFERPLGQGLLALACAAILIVAGIRDRAKRAVGHLQVARDRAGLR